MTFIVLSALAFSLEVGKRVEKWTKIFGTFVPECFSKVQILVLHFVGGRKLEDEAIFIQ